MEDDGLDDDDGDVSLPLRVATPFFRFPTFLLPTALVVASDETALCARDASQSSLFCVGGAMLRHSKGRKRKRGEDHWRRATDRSR